MPPTIGRIVHYKLPDGDKAGEIRPAVVTKVWSDTCVNLCVFPDAGETARSETSVSHDETEAPVNGTWAWPPRS